MCEWKPDFELLRAQTETISKQTEENSKAIHGLAQTNAVQNEQIRTLFKTTEKQSDDLKEQGKNLVKLVNRLVMAIVDILIIFALAVVYGALGDKGFHAVTDAVPGVSDVITK